MEIKKFGAMFLDGLRVGPGVTYDRYLSGSSCPKITFGSVPNEDCCIRWIKVGNSGSPRRCSAPTSVIRSSSRVDLLRENQSASAAGSISAAVST